MRRPPYCGRACSCSDSLVDVRNLAGSRGGVKRRGNNALEKLIEGGNGDDVINYGMVIVGAKRW